MLCETALKDTCICETIYIISLPLDRIYVGLKLLSGNEKTQAFILGVLRFLRKSGEFVLKKCNNDGDAE